MRFRAIEVRPGELLVDEVTVEVRFPVFGAGPSSG
jgi:hypothetical protein